MNLLITGAAGNLGSILTRHLLNSSHRLHLMIHHRELTSEITSHPNTRVHHANLGRPETLTGPCKNINCIVHFAGRLFAPRPAEFLPTTNVTYVENLVSAALKAGVGKFILISFPQVEGETYPGEPSQGLLEGSPDSVHARTRLQAEKHLFKACEGTSMVPVSLRAGMIYARDVLMIAVARCLMRRRLLGVWRQPTWIHLISLPDFLCAVQAAVKGEDVHGIYNLGDESPLTLQEFLDRAASHWDYPRPWRAPEWLFYFAAWWVEAFATVFRTPAPLTHDFIKIGMASYVMDTARMKAGLLLDLRYPSLAQGIILL